MVVLPAQPLSVVRLLWESFKLSGYYWRRGWPLIVLWIALAFADQNVLQPLWALFFANDHQIVLVFVRALLQITVFAHIVYYTLLCAETENTPSVWICFNPVMRTLVSLWVASTIGLYLIILGYGLIVLPGVWLSVAFLFIVPRIVIAKLPVIEAILGCFPWMWGNWFYCFRALVTPLGLLVVALGWLDTLLQLPALQEPQLYEALMMAIQCFLLPWLAAILIQLSHAVELEQIAKKTVDEKN